MPPVRPRVLLVGFTGYPGQDHQSAMYLPALRAHQGIDVVGVCVTGDPEDAERGKSAAADLHLPVFRDLATAVRGTGATAACVCAPLDGRADVLAAAIDLGLDILADKPLTRSGAEANRIAALCSVRSTVLSVAHHQRFQPIIGAAAAAVAGGRIGLPWNIQADFVVAGGTPITEGELRNFGVYPLDVVDGLTGLRPRRVHAMSIDRTGFRSLYVLALQHDHGMASTVVVGRTAALTGVPPGALTAHRYRIAGSHGTLEVDAIRPAMTVRATTPVTLPPGASSVDGWLADWYRAVTTGTRPATSARVATRVMHALDAAARSLRSGRPEDVCDD